MNVLKGHADVRAVRSLVRDSDVDILALQEVTTEWLDKARVSAIAQRLPFELSEVVPFAAASGSALFSCTPLRGHDTIEGTAFKNLRAVTDLPGARAAKVLTIHTKPHPPETPGTGSRTPTPSPTICTNSVTGRSSRPAAPTPPGTRHASVVSCGTATATPVNRPGPGTCRHIRPTAGSATSPSSALTT